MIADGMIEYEGIRLAVKADPDNGVIIASGLAREQTSGKVWIVVVHAEDTNKLQAVLDEYFVDAYAYTREVLGVEEPRWVTECSHSTSV